MATDFIAPALDSSANRRQPRYVTIDSMGELRIENPGLPADYLPRRLARLHRRGDIVREYKEVATELYASLVSDIRAGRKRAALVHFRPFADYCVNCLFVAYPATENELDRRKLPNGSIRAAKRIIDHWKIPVGGPGFKKLERYVPRSEPSRPRRQEGS